MISYLRAVVPAVVVGLGLFGLACGGSGSPTGVDPAESRGAAVQGPSPSARTTPTPQPSPSVNPTPSPTPRPSPTPDPEDETEFRGVIETISGSDLTVSGRLVHTNGNTRIRRSGDVIPFSALAVGQTVEVEGATQPDGSVLASKVTLEDDDEDETEFRGTIQSINGSDLTVAGRLVHTNAATRIRRKGDPIPFSALAVGQTVEVEGTTRSDGSVLASKVTLEDDDVNPGVEVKFEGTIQRVANTDLVVSGRLVHTHSGTRIRHKGDDLPVSALAVGQRVKVEGLGQADGSVLATRIDLED